MKIKRALISTAAAMLLPATLLAQPLPDIDPAEGTAVFVVQKIFSDRNDETPVTINMSCSSGNPTEQSRTVIPGPGQLHGQFEVAFVLDNIPDSDDVNCTIFEDTVAGYSAEYRCFDTGATDPDDSCVDNPGVQNPLADACVFNGVVPSNDDNGAIVNLCAIRNIPNPAEISITKEWIIDGTVGNTVDYEASVHIESTDYFANSFGCKGNKYCGSVNFEGPATETHVIEVLPTFEGAIIYVEEHIYDSVWDSENDCGGTMAVMPTGYEGASGSDSCTFTNTAYFEGIPTLNQYGMAIMALLMLGIGFIGFRRFV